MRRLSLATASFDKHGKVTRRAAFLAEMERVVPWRELCAVIGTADRRLGWNACCGCTFCSTGPTCLTQRRRDLGREPVPDETTILNFRHLLERHTIPTKRRIGAGGTIVDATSGEKHPAPLGELRSR